MLCVVVFGLCVLDYVLDGLCCVVVDGDFGWCDVILVGYVLE